ncbi:hypothetical protein GLOTRDRAFT_121112 [Gloeophyllum trabeum ATCC 11539]|uniref:Methyltransferase domain-containing protein n=1 Tax=Gloeophyllum trabeum (strain ATCC 11539 / FP-39264 / Madison 617) TaxID=670483 RepID=S7Q7V2_GLOTA|nr:uncharacterized protein GLOTRDRAFT_121112 [Gloeophyllum trabeum ATCC 11539]EPQ55518.1 hypothetical protein GLOTRDRAFT_121112 [Gloeophyllum trabeum ATCC 11539]
MPSVLQRHPRYSLFVLLVLSGTLYMLATDSLWGYGSPHVVTYDPSLSSRIAKSEMIYERMLKKRQQLIERFGPSPKDIATFPPNEEPWPAYTVWDFFPPAFNCPHELERIGDMGDGGKWTCGLSRVEQNPDCIVYSIGINYESSFEAELLSRTRHCQVWGYDFTVSSFGPQIPKSLRSRAHFHPYRLAGTDANEDAQYTLEALMQMNGHTHIDILKIDIESWEFETLAALIKPYVASGKPLPFGQLQLEIHLWGKKFSEFLAWWTILEEAGLRPFMTEPNLVYQNYNKESNTELAEYSFLNVKGDNIFISDPPVLQSVPNPAKIRREGS